MGYDHITVPFDRFLEYCFRTIKGRQNSDYRRFRIADEQTGIVVRLLQAERCPLMKELDHFTNTDIGHGESDLKPAKYERSAAGRVLAALG